MAHSTMEWVLTSMILSMIPSNDAKASSRIGAPDALADHDPLKNLSVIEDLLENAIDRS